ncbi:hypothetical protein [Schaedlerella sp.]|nr:hypothetical protein [uncultured Schaedlerella sp.]
MPALTSRNIVGAKRHALAWIAYQFHIFYEDMKPEREAAPEKKLSRKD